MSIESGDASSMSSLRLIPIVCVMGISLACVGYLAGLLENNYVEPQNITPEVSTESGAVKAVDYLDQPRSTMSPNLKWSQRFDPSKQMHLSSVPNKAPGLKAKMPVLVAREKLRAYNGAPPVIPHPVDDVSVETCLACHENGMSLGELVAPAIPHEPYKSCTQCHAPPAEAFLVSKQLPQSTFKGLKAPTKGDRASSIAPPVIPHSTHMRENCLSCHGPSGDHAMKSTHPERRSCQQCHGQSAKLNQGPSTSSFLKAKTK